MKDPLVWDIIFIVSDDYLWSGNNWVWVWIWGVRTALDLHLVNQWICELNFCISKNSYVRRICIFVDSLCLLKLNY